MPQLKHFLDITTEVCPMTYVRAKLKLEGMGEGEILELRLRGEEPRENLPKSLAEDGHDVLSITQESDGAHCLLLRKKRRSATWQR
jgi:TusA-related sulfurtransferase